MRHMPKYLSRPCKSLPSPPPFRIRLAPTSGKAALCGCWSAGFERQPCQPCLPACLRACVPACLALSASPAFVGQGACSKRCRELCSCTDYWPLLLQRSCRAVQSTLPLGNVGRGDRQLLLKADHMLAAFMHEEPSAADFGLKHACGETTTFPPNRQPALPNTRPGHPTTHVVHPPRPHASASTDQGCNPGVRHPDTRAARRRDFNGRPPEHCCAYEQRPTPFCVHG